MLDSIFSADSALMRVLGKAADVIVLNLIFVATSLPVVTLGASVTALHGTAMRIVRGRSESVTGDYLRAFRENVRRGSQLLLVLASLAGVLAAWYVVVTTFVAGVAQLVLLVIWLVLVVQLALTGLFAFPYLATFDDVTSRVLRNARLMAWRHPLTALAAMALTSLPVVVTVFYPRVAVYGLLWFAFGFAAVAVLTGILFVRVFDTYIPAPRSDLVTKDGTARALS
ncbi:YesL family protein [Pseudactinotalea suaedae]|uniref:YesL family protein n=1 Tax=Pseudactinotalea suaedae TaxID=1524924 RepID=UPI0012E0EFB0|nr:YesL family protein [Pseudactinotalea suaedae]